MVTILFALYLYETYHVLESLKAFYNIMVEGNHNLESNIQFLSVSIIVVLITHGSAYFIESIISNKNQPDINNELAAGSSLATGHPDLDKFFNSLNFSDKEFIVERVIEKTNGDLLSKVTNKYNIFNKSQNSIGKYIGIIERLLIAILVVNSAFTGIVIIAAFKTFARHKQLEEKAFAEYYLLGSFLSILLAFVFGYMLTRLI